MPRDARDDDRRRALDEILAKGRTKRRQERWVVLGGLLMQGKRNLSYEEYESSLVTMPKKAPFHPGIQTHDHPTFQNRSANAVMCPCALPLWALLGPGRASPCSISC